MLRIKVDMSDVERGLNDLVRRQVPYAKALALTALAKRVAAAETKALASTFDRPTPFTMKAFAVKAARKSDPTAVVFAKDIQAIYLSPFAEDGTHRQLLRGKAIAKPIGVATNQYGNLPRGRVKALLGRDNTFMGTVHFKNGVAISGVWQRPTMGKQRRKRYGIKGANLRNGRSVAGVGVRTGLKLLIRFADPVPVRPRFEFQRTALRTIQASAKQEWEAALAKALATAR